MAAKRRGHNEGTISERSDGRWEARLSLPNGKRKCFYGKTRKDVAQKLAAALRDQQQGLPIVAERQTVAQYLEQWLNDTARHTLRPRTFIRYQQLIRKHALPSLGKLALAKLTPQHLSALYGERLATGLSPRSVQFLHAVLHRALKQAMRWDLIARNPADLVDAPRPKRPEIHPLTAEAVQRLREAAQGDPLEALYALALMTGMRQGEILGLRWADLDLDAGRLEVHHTLYHARDGWHLAEPKTGRSRRMVKLAPSVVAALKAHRARQAADRLQVGPAWQDHGFVFTSSVGTPLNFSHLRQRSWLPLLRRAGLPSVRFHDLRHTVATGLLQDGVPLVKVRDLLGHSTITITADIYAAHLPPEQDEIADRMERLFGDAAANG